ncbi:MAG: hypothetical protein WC099_01460 [Candidatus Paceibacterota bacterium]
MHKQHGQILIEVMLAISVSVISLIGFFGLLQTSFKLSRLTSENYVAAHLAVEGVEIIANIVQRNYVEMEGNLDQTYYFNKDIESGDFEFDYTADKINSSVLVTTPLSRPIQLQGSTFYRRVHVDSSGSQIQVSSYVYTNAQGIGVPLATVQDTFLNWWQQTPPVL